MARQSDTRKFIPLLRHPELQPLPPEQPDQKLIPDFLGPRLWVDFRDDAGFEQSLKELLHELFEVPRYPKPALGVNPFLGGGKGAGAGLAPAELVLQPQPQRQVQVEAVEQELGEGSSLRLIRIPAGEFLMGSPPDEPERSNNEGPQHKVKLASFFISQTPITQAQWRAVAQWQPRQGERWERELKANPSRFQPKDAAEEKKERYGSFRLLEWEPSADLRPVERVSWWEAREFCSRLSQRTGRHYTLPSEAQWEYACRAGTSTPFSFGDTITPELANYDGTYTYGNGPKGVYREQPTPVGMFPANAWGLQDMHGNVWEWCLDDWHGSYEGAPVDGTAWLDGVEEKSSKGAEEWKPLRGGSWLYVPWICRSAYRFHYLPDYASSAFGFRVVCLPQGPSLNP
jgi:formylglycine-generating enzyme required for sulfatase activity